MTLRTWNTTSPGAPATERETDAYDLGFRDGWRDRGEDRVTEAAPPPDTALREAARAAVEPHLMRIVNRTKPMEQAEGLAILADLDAALTETDHAAGVTLDRRPAPPEPALLGDERGVTLDAQSTANDAKLAAPPPTRRSERRYERRWPRSTANASGPRQRWAESRGSGGAMRA